MNLFFLSACAGLTLKLFVLAHVIKGAKISKPLLLLIIAFTIHNTIDVFGYLDYVRSNLELTSYVFHTYYVATTYMVTYIMIHALKISNSNQKYITVTSILLATILSALIIFSNLILGSEQHINESIRAIKGPLYWFSTSYFSLSLLITFLILINAQRSSKSSIKARHCKYNLMALIPILFAGLIVVTLKTLDIKLTSTGLLSLATTISLIIIIRTESKHELSNISRFFPLSLERQTANSFLNLLDKYVENGHKENVYKDLQHGIEKEIVSYSLKKCNNNISKTAKMMGIRNRSTLYAMIKRLGIEHESTQTNTNQTTTEEHKPRR